MTPMAYHMTVSAVSCHEPPMSMPNSVSVSDRYDSHYNIWYSSLRSIHVLYLGRFIRKSAKTNKEKQEYEHKKIMP